MKILISFLTFLVVLTSCKKQDSLEPLTPAKNVSTLTNGIPVSFEYSSCERPEITFRGETYGEVTTITSDSTVTLRDDQQYSVSFRLVAERCSPGEIILGGDNPANSISGSALTPHWQKNNM